MTAVNVFLYSDAAVVMTDGLAIEADGSNRRIVQKILPLAHLNAVVAIRGPVWMLSALVDVIGQCHRTFDAARAAMAHDLRRMVDLFQGRLPMPDGPDWTQFHLIGKSEASGQFESWICAAGDLPGLAAYDARQTNTMVQPGVADCDAHTQRLAARARAEDGRFDPDTDGLRLMRGQMRAFPKWVGGLCQITVLSDDGISTRILERWPEPVAA